MTSKYTTSPFAFDFASVSIDDNLIDEFPKDVVLPAEVTAVAYKNLAKKDSGEDKPRLVITQDVHWDSKKARFETIISEKQTYILKQYLVAVGIDADALSNQALDAESLEDSLKGVPIGLMLTDKKWQDKTYTNFKKVTAYENTEVEDDMPF